MNSLEKTGAVVLNRTKYGETSLIVTLLTPMDGRVTVMVKGAFNKKSTLRANLFQPLSLLHIELNNSTKRDIQWLKEASLAVNLGDLYSNPFKCQIAMLVEEVLSRCLYDEPNAEAFDYIWTGVRILNSLDGTGTANFHLAFLLGYTRHLGIYPSLDYSTDNCWFDLKSGHFTAFPSEMNIGESLSPYWYRLLVTPLTEISSISMNRDIRNRILDGIFSFYQLHIPSFKVPRSLDILRAL